MGLPTDHDVDAYVQRILAEADTDESQAVERLRERTALLTATEQSELVDRARQKNPPLMASTGPQLPPPVAIVGRRRSATGASTS